jgi:hypothetical protein
MLMNKRAAYAFQLALAAVGLTAASLTYADIRIAWIAASGGVILEVVALIWFWRTYRTTESNVGRKSK